LLLYTDGITEVIDEQNREFGADRLAQALWSARSLPVQEIPAYIRSEVERFSAGAPLSDDVTIVVSRMVS
jgi:sigma-B regulation protein RsbU (phosphoserine phosphatase)